MHSRNSIFKPPQRNTLIGPRQTNAITKSSSQTTRTTSSSTVSLSGATCRVTASRQPKTIPSSSTVSTTAASTTNRSTFAHLSSRVNLTGRAPIKTANFVNGGTPALLQIPSASQRGLPDNKQSSTPKANLRRSTRLASSTASKATSTPTEKKAKEIFSKKKCLSSRRTSQSNVFFCPVCFENIIETGGRIYGLHCGHVFCNVCLSSSFEKKLQCPICQICFKSIDEAGIRSLFL